MITVNCKAEFSIELVLAVPYAYWLHKNNILEKTISVSDTKTLYYFSENHEETNTYRTIDNKDAGLDALPNNWIHHNPDVSDGRPGILDFSKWEMPPFKQYYKNDIFKFDNPLLIISNKYSVEWGGPPVNFIDIETLYYLIDNLSEHYTIIYKRPKNTDYIADENELAPVGDIIANVNDENITDYELCKRMGVILFRELKNEYPEMTYNEFQFKLFANCDNYISVQGGNSHICSLFGTTNINYAVKGRETHPDYFNKDTWYYKMNECNTIGVSSYESLISKSIELYEKN